MIVVLLITFTAFLVLIYGHLVKKRELKLTEAAKYSFAGAAARDAVLLAKKVYVRYISHEIRTPLNAAYLGLKILEKEISKAKGPNYLERLITVRDVVNACDVAVVILNDLLNYDKLEDDSLTIEPKKVEALPFLISCTKLFLLPAEEKGIQVIFDIAEDSFAAEDNAPRHCYNNHLFERNNSEKKSEFRNDAQNRSYERDNYEKHAKNDDDRHNIDGDSETVEDGWNNNQKDESYSACDSSLISFHSNQMNDKKNIFKNKVDKNDDRNIDCDTSNLDDSLGSVNSNVNILSGSYHGYGDDGNDITPLRTEKCYTEGSLKRSHGSTADYAQYGQHTDIGHVIDINPSHPSQSKSYPSSRIHSTAHSHQTMPPIDDSCFLSPGDSINIDEHKMSQVIRNLVSNAIKVRKLQLFSLYPLYPYNNRQ